MKLLIINKYEIIINCAEPKTDFWLDTHFKIGEMSIITSLQP